MKHGYSVGALDKSIGMILPAYLACKDAGIDTNRPSWMKMVAEDYFLKYSDTGCGDYKTGLAYYVVKCAMTQLHEEGFMTFGERGLEV